MIALKELIGLFLKLGVIGFGGPQAHIALMEHECVVRRGWLTSERFAEGLALCNLLPGPASTQLAIWLGYERRGYPGGVAAGLVFLLPSFVLVVALAALYRRFGTIPAAQHLLYGIKPAVIAIVLATCWRLAQPVRRDAKQLAVLAAAVVLALAFPTATVWVLLGAGLLGLCLYGPRRRRAAVHLWPLFFFFLKTGAFIFGGGLVLIPLIQGQVVDRNGWLTARQFVDAVAVGQMTPGPVVITAAFIGYLVGGGLAGAAAATAGIFLPSFAFILAAAPFLRRVQGNARVKGFLKGVLPAVIGTILAATAALARAALEPLLLWNVGSGLLLAAALAATIHYRTNPGVVIVLCGLAGLLARAL